MEANYLLFVLPENYKSRRNDRPQVRNGSPELNRKSTLVKTNTNELTRTIRPILKVKSLLILSLPLRCQ